MGDPRRGRVGFGRRGGNIATDQMHDGGRIRFPGTRLIEQGQQRGRVHAVLRGEGGQCARSDQPLAIEPAFPGRSAVVRLGAELGEGQSTGFLERAQFPRQPICGRTDSLRQRRPTRAHHDLKPFSEVCSADICRSARRE